MPEPILIVRDHGAQGRLLGVLLSLAGLIQLLCFAVPSSNVSSMLSLIYWLTGVGLLMLGVNLMLGKVTTVIDLGTRVVRRTFSAALIPYWKVGPRQIAHHGEVWVDRINLPPGKGKVGPVYMWRVMVPVASQPKGFRIDHHDDPEDALQQAAWLADALQLELRGTVQHR